MHPQLQGQDAWQPGRWGPWNDSWIDQPRPGSARRRLLIPVVLSLLVQLPPALFVVTYLGRVTPSTLAALALAVIGPLLLLGARRFPGPVVALVTVAACADFAIDSSPSPYIAIAFAIGSAIIRGARAWAWISVGVCWVLTIVVGALFGLQWHPARVAVTTLLVLLVFGAGESIRTRRERFEEYRKQRAQRRQTEVQAERARIARELHDVLAHSLSQINVQAGVGLHLMDAQPQKAKEALASIKDSSKSALDEVRSLLGVLRADGTPEAPLVPEPDLSRLPGLVASVNTQGVEVELRNELSDAPKAVQLAIYRIVQESLTNVVRHAHASRARVTVAEVDGAYVIEVADDGDGLDTEVEGGRGMLGMRERAELLGGTLETGRSDLGGALVTVRIPVTEHL